MLPMLFLLQDHRFLYPPPVPLTVNNLLLPPFPPNSQRKLAYLESSINFILSSNHIPLAMAPPHPTEIDRFPKLGRLVGRMN